MTDNNKLTTVMYHYVRDLNKSKFPNIKGLDLALFNKQIDYLQARYNIVTIESVINHIEGRHNLPSKPLLLTFDDGFADHYNNVFPVLMSRGIYACFYVSAKSIVEKIVLDVHKLHFILASSSIKSLIYKIKKLLDRYRSEHELEEFDFYYNKLAQPSRLDNKDIIFVKRLLQVELEEEVRHLIVKDLFIEYVSDDEESFSKELYMDIFQLKHMVKEGMHIGCHGYDHYWWNSLDNNKLKDELDLSLSFLSKIGFNKNYWTACYPYGSYDQQSIRMLKERRCKLAFTTDLGTYDLNQLDRLKVPRFDTNDFGF